MVKALRSIGTPAPDSLVDSVMAAVGLVDSWTRIEGPIGPLYVAWGPDGITAAEPARDAAGFETEYELRHGRSLRRVAEMPEQLETQVHKRLEGRHTDGPAVDLATLTDFEQAVLHKTMEIPYGEVRPYSWVAREDRPAAGGACGRLGAGGQSDHVHHPLPPRGTGRWAYRQLRRRRPGGEAQGAEPGRHRHIRARADGRRRRPLSRVRLHHDLLLSLVSTCAPHHGGP